MCERYVELLFSSLVWRRRFRCASTPIIYDSRRFDLHCVCIYNQDVICLRLASVTLLCTVVFRAPLIKLNR